MKLTAQHFLFTAGFVVLALAGLFHTYSIRNLQAQVHALEGGARLEPEFVNDRHRVRMEAFRNTTLVTARNFFSMGALKAVGEVDPATPLPSSDDLHRMWNEYKSSPGNSFPETLHTLTSMCCPTLEDCS